MYIIMNMKHLASQKVGHDIQMAYYLALTTHVQVLSTYMMWCQLGHNL